MSSDRSPLISGSTAAEIVDRVRDLVATGELATGDSLPAIRELAVDLGVNRNTVAAAYRLLVAAGIAQTHGRGGTAIVGAPVLAREGVAGGALIRNLASGNPDPLFLPDPEPVLRRLRYVPPLYGAPTIDADLLDWANVHFSGDVDRDFRVVLAHGAVDAVERILTAHLTRGDQVVIEDPCFISSIGTLRLNGFRARPVETDEHGMDPTALSAALSGGARAVILTPRALNPTGASLTDRRAAEVRRVLAEHPTVLVIEDDHFSALSAVPYRRATPPVTSRWALVRSVSKFLGPDLRLAFIATDAETASRLETRLSPGTTWVSHLLQRLVHGLLTDERVTDLLSEARAAYAARAGFLVDALNDRGIPTARHPDGLNVWIAFDHPVHALISRLHDIGWLVRPGDLFSADERLQRNAVRVTTAALGEVAAHRFATELADLSAELGVLDQA